MKIILVLTLFLIINSCDMPNNSRRSLRGSVNNSVNNQNANSVSTGNTGNTGNTGGAGRTPGSTLTSDIPTDASQCTWKSLNAGNYQYPITGSSVLGRYNICRSNTNANKIYFQVETAEPDYNICFIPTSHVGSNSFYVGEPRCFRASSTTTIYPVDLLINRPNFSQYSITGVMILKDKLNFYPGPYYQNSLNPDAYLFCSEMLYQRGISTYCQTFKQLGKYVYHKL